MALPFWTNKAIRYLVEKTDKYEKPESFMEWVRDFVKTAGYDKSDVNLKSAIARRLERIDEIPGFNLNQKAHLLFVLSLPVNMLFLEKAKNAGCLIELDDRRRICLYSSKDNYCFVGDHNQRSKLFKGKIITLANSPTTPQTRKPEITLSSAKKTLVKKIAIPTPSASSTFLLVVKSAPSSSATKINIPTEHAGPSSRKRETKAASFDFSTSFSRSAHMEPSSSNIVIPTMAVYNNYESEDDPEDAERDEENVKREKQKRRGATQPHPSSTHRIETSEYRSTTATEAPPRETKCSYRLPEHEKHGSTYNAAKNSDSISGLSNALPMKVLEGSKKARKQNEEVAAEGNELNSVTAREFLVHLQRCVEVLNSQALNATRARIHQLLSSKAEKVLNVKNSMRILRAFSVSSPRGPAPLRGEESVHLCRFLQLLHYLILVLDPEGMNGSNELLKAEVTRAGDKKISMERVAQALQQLLLAAFPDSV